MALATGTRLGQYEIVKPIGAGGMGEVYQARDTRLERTVALKLLPTLLTRDATAKARFIQEAKAASGLDHPNICTIYDIGEADDARSRRGRGTGRLRGRATFPTAGCPDPGAGRGSWRGCAFLPASGRGGRGGG